MGITRRSLASAGLLACCGALLLATGPAGARHKAHAVAAPLTAATWLNGVQVTEYYPAPERWFVGQRVTAPGLREPHRIDWLYSGRGVSMEGDGIGLDGRQFHIASLGDGGWINAQARPTDPGSRAGWSDGSPFWRAGGYWLTHARLPTFPLEAGGWSNGPGVRYVPLPGVSFATGPSLPLRYYRSVAVDPNLIPLGSRVLIPAYARITPSHGWFIAQDTGGAILGHHVDVYRSPPAAPTDGGRFLTGQRVYVIPPHALASPTAPPAHAKPKPTPTPTPTPAVPGAAQAP
jgi:3D (Asp-Asp-Asp) domain-containing protein